MRAHAVVLVAVVLVAGCGDTGKDPGAQALAGSLRSLWRQPGQDVGLVMGTSDYAQGSIRVSFLVVSRNGKPVSRPTARVWVARGLDERPFARATARLEPLGVPGGYKHDHGVTHTYVTHLRLPRPANYWLLAEPVGSPRIQGLGNVVVKSRSETPAVGARAIPSRTPTLMEAGHASELTTRIPPDSELLRHSVADSLRARVPFVLVFATPKYCTSRTCGPVVDVVDAVRRRTEGRPVRFIHVEIYEGNDPSRGPNRFVREWSLPNEPWTFLVGADGRIKAKFEGSYSVAELEAAVRRFLL